MKPQLLTFDLTKYWCCSYLTASCSFGALLSLGQGVWNLCDLFVQLKASPSPLVLPY